jgi:hypothetical protein
MALKLLGSDASGANDATPLQFFAYSEISLAANTVVTASNGTAIQATGWSTAVTGYGQTPGSSGITVPAGLYLATVQVKWNAASTIVRYPLIYDGTMYHFGDTGAQINSSGSVGTLSCMLRLTGSTLVQAGFTVASTTASIRTIKSTGSDTLLSIQRLA